jgi:predicted transcriptional regulator
MAAMKLVRDIMIPIEHYPSVRDRAPLREAVAVIEEAQLEVELRRSLPRVLLVFDQINILVGYVRRRDIMRGLAPRFILSTPLDYPMKLFDVAVDPNLSELSNDRLAQDVRQQGERPVSDVMQPIETTLQADDHVLKAVNEMVSLDLALVPVLEHGRVVGVIRSVDVFHELASLLTPG